MHIYILLLILDLIPLAGWHPKRLEECPAHNWCSIKIGGKNEINVIQ